jgi:hypothetical protein
MSLVIYNDNDTSVIEDELIPIAHDITNKKIIFISKNRKKDENQNRIEHEYKPDNANLEIIPFLNFNVSGRSACFISGPSGSGKSTIAANLIKWYRILHKQPHRDIFLFTRSEGDDPAFQIYKDEKIQQKNKRGEISYYSPFRKIHIENQFDILKQLKPRNLANGIVIFDDFEASTDLGLKKYIFNFVKKLLEESRKLKVDIICITHQATQGPATKPILYECNQYINFPLSATSSFRKLMKHYSELDDNEVNEVIKNLQDGQSFFSYHKQFPLYYMTKNYVKCL